jgi:hypothetical protein
VTFTSSGSSADTLTASLVITLSGGVTGLVVWAHNHRW